MTELQFTILIPMLGVLGFITLTLIDRKQKSKHDDTIAKYEQASQAFISLQEHGIRIIKMIDELEKLESRHAERLEEIRVIEKDL